MKRIARMIRAGIPFSFDGKKVIASRKPVAGRKRLHAGFRYCNDIAEAFGVFGAKVDEFQLVQGVGDYVPFVEKSLIKTRNNLDMLGVPSPSSIAYEIKQEPRYYDFDPVVYTLVVEILFRDGEQTGLLAEQLGWKKVGSWLESPNSEWHDPEVGWPSYIFLADDGMGQPKALAQIDICFSRDGSDLLFDSVMM